MKLTKVSTQVQTEKALRKHGLKTKATGGANRKNHPEKLLGPVPLSHSVRKVKEGVHWNTDGSLTICWHAGWIYVGNGVLGVTDSVYFKPRGASSTVLTGAASFDTAAIPIAGSDTIVGAAYIRDQAKHFARKQILEMALFLQENFPATTNDCLVALAPVAGPFTMASTVSTTGFAIAGASAAAVESFDGSDVTPCWSPKSWDMTKYIKGGSGSKQNEFAISSVGTTTTVIGSGNDQEGVVPACFVVGGSNATAALRGQAVMNVMVQQRVRFIDYVGDTTFPDAVALYSREIERNQSLLEQHLRWLEAASVDRTPKTTQTATCRQLFDLRRRLRESGIPKTEFPDASYCPSGCPGCAQREAAIKSRPE